MLGKIVHGQFSRFSRELNVIRYRTLYIFVIIIERALRFQAWSIHSFVH